MDEFRYQMTRTHWFPTPMRIVDMDEVMQLCPLLNPNNVRKYSCMRSRLEFEVFFFATAMSCFFIYYAVHR